MIAHFLKFEGLHKFLLDIKINYEDSKLPLISLDFVYREKGNYCHFVINEYKSGLIYISGIGYIKELDYFFNIKNKGKNGIFWLYNPFSPDDRKTLKILENQGEKFAKAYKSGFGRHKQNCELFMQYLDFFNNLYNIEK